MSTHKDFEFVGKDIIEVEEDEVLEGELIFTDGFGWELDDTREKRNLHNEQNKFPAEEKRLKRQIDIKDILLYLPSKVLINSKVYQFTLKYKGPNVWINLTNRIDDIVDEGKVINEEDLHEIEAILRPEIPFAFHEDDTAYVLMEVLNLLIEVNAIEVTENLKLNGNHRLYEFLDYIMDL